MYEGVIIDDAHTIIQRTYDTLLESASGDCSSSALQYNRRVEKNEWLPQDVKAKLHRKKRGDLKRRQVPQRWHKRSQTLPSKVKSRELGVQTALFDMQTVLVYIPPKPTVADAGACIKTALMSRRHGSP